MARVFLLLLGICLFETRSAEVRWRHLSSATNQIPLPSTAKLQTGSTTGDFDGDKINDFVLSFSDAAPALVLYQGGTNWTTLPIELEFLPVAAGGAAIDVDIFSTPNTAGTPRLDIWLNFTEFKKTPTHPK